MQEGRDRVLLIISDWDKLGSLISMYLLHLWQYKGGNGEISAYPESRVRQREFKIKDI